MGVTEDLYNISEFNIREYYRCINADDALRRSVYRVWNVANELDVPRLMTLLTLSRDILNSIRGYTGFTWYKDERTENFKKSIDDYCTMCGQRYHILVVKLVTVLKENLNKLAGYELLSLVNYIILLYETGYFGVYS